MNAPCYNCLDRYTTCHDSCDKFMEFKKYMESQKEARNKFNYGRSVIIESSLRQTLSRMK